MGIKFNELCGVGNSCCYYFEERGYNCGFISLNSEVIALFTQEPFFVFFSFLDSSAYFLNVDCTSPNLVSCPANGFAYVKSRKNKTQHDRLAPASFLSIFPSVISVRSHVKTVM